MTKPILNTGTLNEIIAMGGPTHPELLTKVIKSFLLDAPSQIESIEQALHARNAEALHEAAHKLKSSSISMGAEKLAEACFELEMIGKNGQLDYAHTDPQTIKNAFEEARPLFEQFI